MREKHILLRREDDDHFIRGPGFRYGRQASASTTIETGDCEESNRYGIILSE